MKIKKVKHNILRFLGNILLFPAVNVLCKSLKIEIKNSDRIIKHLKDGEKIVLAFWHGTMLIPWYLHRNNNFAALVSTSKDGDLLANILTKWNYDVARGSSHKGGKEALEMLLEKGKENYSIAITPDGPTGPPREMKAGAVITAQRTGLPLILCGVANKKKYKLNSWDGFEIPKFFSRVVVNLSEPIFIDKNLNRDETSDIIKEYNDKLNHLQKEAENIA